MVAPAASAASRPLLRLGHCVGSIGDMTPYTIGTERSLLQLAIPERQVTVVPLNKSCSNPDGTASGDYVDVLFLVGWGFAQQIKDAVIQPRNEARRRRKKKHTGSGTLRRINRMHARAVVRSARGPWPLYPLSYVLSGH